MVEKTTTEKSSIHTSAHRQLRENSQGVSYIFEEQGGVSKQEGLIPDHLDNHDAIITLNEMVLISGIFDRLPNEYNSDDEEQLFGCISFLENYLSVEDTVYRSRGDFQDKVIQLLSDADSRQFQQLQRRWDQIVGRIAAEAAESSAYSAADMDYYAVNKYSREKKLMMKFIIREFGALQLRHPNAPAIVAILEKVLGISQLSNVRGW